MTFEISLGITKKLIKAGGVKVRSQGEMYNFLKKNLKSHTVEIDGDKIIAKRNQRWNFSSFRLTYLKNGMVSMKNISYPSRTIRYNNDDDIFCQMGAMASIEY